METLKTKQAEEAALVARIAALEEELAAAKKALPAATAAMHAAKRAAAAVIPYKERVDRTYRMFRGTYSFDIAAVSPDGQRHPVSRYQFREWYKTGIFTQHMIGHIRYPEMAAVIRKAEDHMEECGAAYEDMSCRWGRYTDFHVQKGPDGCPVIYYTLKTWGEWTPMCTLTLDIIFSDHPEKGKEGWKLMALTGKATENPMKRSDMEYRPEEEGDWEGDEEEEEDDEEEDSDDD